MILERFGAPLTLRDVPAPKTGPSDVLIRVRVCGVGLTVVSMIATPGRITSFPRIPGHEIAGEVVEIGSGRAHGDHRLTAEGGVRRRSRVHGQSA
jgi:D-arabinose 1-dehydrogenase-like Zn-dependent alcohol dehydrogenase